MRKGISAAMNSSTGGTTQARPLRLVTMTTSFGRDPHPRQPLFQLQPGLPLEAVAVHASCVVDALREIANDGARSDGLSPAKSWLIADGLDKVFALLSSIEQAIETSAPVGRSSKL